MTTMFHAFKVLGVHLYSTDEEIKESHRRLAMKYHPDRGGTDTGQFIEIQQAYERLKGVAPLQRIRLLEILGIRCGTCAARGTRAKQKGWATRTLEICGVCGGAGYTLTGNKA